MFYSIQDFNQILVNNQIKATCVNIQIIDNFTLYDLQLHPNAKVQALYKFGDELSLAIKAPCKPSIKIMRELGLVRMEFINSINTQPNLKLFEYCEAIMSPPGDLVACLGKTVSGKRLWMDLADNPHMIVAGTTGSGKSTLLHNIIGNMLRYNDCLMYLIDPKGIDFQQYKKITNCSVIDNFTMTNVILDSLVHTMEERFIIIKNGGSIDKMPYILLIIDEFADLIMQDVKKQFYNKLCRLAQKCRAAHMSIILSTQRPSVKVIDGSIKANFPARIACRVASHYDSKVILDVVGAENLMGNGDAICRSGIYQMERFQIAYTDAAEIVSKYGK